MRAGARERAALVVVASPLVIAGCGARNGLEVGGGASSGAGGGGASITAAACSTTWRGPIYEGDDSAYAAAIAYGDGEVVIAWWSDPGAGDRTLRLSTTSFDPSARITTWRSLVASPILSQAGVARLGDAFYAGFVDESRVVHVTRLSDDGAATDGIVASSTSRCSRRTT